MKKLIFLLIMLFSITTFVGCSTSHKGCSATKGKVGYSQGINKPSYLFTNQYLL